MSSQPAFYWSEIPDGAVWTASETKAGTSAGNLAYATEGNGWSPATSTGSKNIDIDATKQITVDKLIILGENINNAKVQIYTSADGITYAPYAFPVTVVSGAVNAFMWTFAPFNGATSRYWRIAFTQYNSDVFIAHIAMDLEVLLPYLMNDPMADSYTPTAKHLTSKAGLYLGTTQDKTERIMPIDFGEVTPTEKTALQPWADERIKVVRPFFFIVDSSDALLAAPVFFCRIKGGGVWESPLETGVNIVRRFTFITRAV